MGEKKNKVKINIVKESKSRQKIRKFYVLLPNLDHSIKCFVENHKLSQLTDRTMTGWFGMVKHTFSQQTRLLYSAAAGRNSGDCQLYSPTTTTAREHFLTSRERSIYNTDGVTC